MAGKGNGGDFEFGQDAARNRKPNRQEQYRQDQKAMKAGRAERAVGGGSAQYGHGPSVPAGSGALRGSDRRGTG